MTQRILVTGGNGFIGSHLVSLLLRNRYKVRVVDIKSSPVVESGEFLAGDLRDPKFAMEIGDVHNKVNNLTGIGIYFTRNTCRD